MKAHLEELEELRSENTNLRQVNNLPEVTIVVKDDIKNPIDRANTIDEKSVKNLAFISKFFKMFRYLGGFDKDSDADIKMCPVLRIFSSN